MNNPTEPQIETSEHATVIHPDGSWGLLVRQILLSASSRELDTYELMFVALDKERNALRTQVAELTRKRDGAKGAFRVALDDYDNAAAKNAALTRELEQLRADKERLDWFESVLKSETCDPTKQFIKVKEGPRYGEVTLVTYDGLIYHNHQAPTLRAAIDDAMSARNEKETKEEKCTS